MDIHAQNAPFCHTQNNFPELLCVMRLDLNQNYNVLENALTESYSACFPERVVRFNKKKHKKTPWITAGILKSINHRNKLYKNLKQTQIDAINYVAKKANFNQYRNRLNKTIALAKRMYYKHIFDQFKYDMKKTWAILSDILNRKAINPLPDMMTIQGHECSDKKVIAEQFNIFFTTMGMQNVHRDNVHDRHSFRNYLTHQTETNFSFHMIDNNATVRMIKSMKMSQSKGHDGISSELIKLINTDISSSITVTINQSLTSGIFPDKLKIAKVTPIFKKGNKKLICNYRPISVLPVISKVFETVLQEQLTEYFTTNNLFAPQQYGFRKNSSTELAALELIDRLLNQMNNHKIPTNFYIDLSKAFDSLQHDILLEKLAHYGLTNKAIALLKSYLSNRKQYVQLSDVRSSVRPISVGVPQGYRNRLPPYFDNFLPEYGVYGHNLRNDLIRLPAIRCEFGTMNAKYQMHLRLRELANPSNPPLYPPISINEDTLNKSVHSFSEFLKAEFLNSYANICSQPECYVCANSN